MEEDEERSEVGAGQACSVFNLRLVLQPLAAFRLLVPVGKPIATAERGKFYVLLLLL